MARNRVIYQSEALYTSEGIVSTGVSKHVQLERVQSANYNFSISRQDINQFGELGKIDSIVLEPPTVNLDFSYYLTDGTNERALGFYVKTGSATEGNFPSGHMTTTSGKNFFMLTSDEGDDFNYGTGGKNFIGFGNGFLSNYSLEASVGSFPTVSVSIEAANVISSGANFASGTGYAVRLPSVNPSDGSSYFSTGAYIPSGKQTQNTSSISALRPGDITLSFGNLANGGSGVFSDISGDADGIHIQSVSLSIPLSRSSLQRLGTKFPYARAVDFPVNATLSVSAILNEISAENLATMLEDEVAGEISLTFKDKDGNNAVVYTLKGAKLDSESFSSSIGSNKTVELSFSTQIGGPNDTVNGVFVSGRGTGSLF